MRWWVIAALVWLPTGAAAQASSDERGDGRAVPSADDVARINSELAGDWLGPADGDTRRVVSFVDGNAFIRRSLAMMEMRLFRTRTNLVEVAAGMRETLEGSDLATLTDRVGDLQADRLGARLDLDEAALRAGAAELSAALLQSLREDLELTLVILDDAISEGDGSLTEISVGLTRRGDFGRTERPEAEIIAYSGNRLYFIEDGGVEVYQRVSTIEGALLDHWDSLRGRRTYDRYLEGEYNRLFRACFELQREGQPLDECRAHRDAMAGFGVELQPEGVLERNLDFEKPTPEQMAFWREPSAMSAPQEAIPSLSYCYAGADSGIPAFLAQLAADGYRDTMWRIAFSSTKPVEKPRNWTDQEFNTLTGGAYQGAIHLRGDGVIGLSPLFQALFSYDPRNRWTYVDGEIVLSLGDGAGQLRLELGDYTTVPAVSDFALADEASALLVRGDFDVLPWMAQAQAHPEFERLLPYAQSQSCPDAGAAAPPVESAPPATEPQADPEPAASESTTAAPATDPAPSPDVAPEPVETPEPDFDETAIVGCWLWSNGARISIGDGGVATNGPARGRWSADSGARSYRIEWPIVDRIRLSADGRSFQGTGVAGIEFTGTRVAGDSGMAGSWRRQDGVILDFDPEGGATGAGLSGRWTLESDGSVTVTWALVDTIVLSEDGQRLEIENLFGSATATRQAGC